MGVYDEDEDQDEELAVQAYHEVTRTDPATGAKSKVFVAVGDLTSAQLAKAVRSKKKAGRRLIDEAADLYEYGRRRHGDDFTSLFEDGFRALD